MTSQTIVMKTFTFVCFLFAVLLATEGDIYSEFDENLNKIASPRFNCFKEREGATCPPGSACGKSRIRCKNTTQCCGSTSKILTYFYLFTWRNKENPEFLHKCGGRLPENTCFDKNVTTFVLTHGLFDGPCRTAAWREMKNQLFVRGKCNVILVDWSKENLPDIAIALNTNRNIGRRLACVIENIMIQTGVTGDRFHLVGHSMGSHISGFAGKHINKCKYPKIRRITALDPSNIGEFGYPPNRRLSRNDAQCVDAIHVNIGDCFPFNLGYMENIGHADFYPNGGSHQFSCYPMLLQSVLKLDLFYAAISLIPSFCHHLQSLQYFKISINPCESQFVGVECKDYQEFQSGACRTCNQNGSNCAVMGLDFENFNGPCTGSHQYFLTTTLTCPYCDNSNIRLNGFLENSGKEKPGQHCFES